MATTIQNSLVFHWIFSIASCSCHQCHCILGNC